jgi:hypothetical protein
MTSIESEPRRGPHPRRTGRFLLETIKQKIPRLNTRYSGWKFTRFYDSSFTLHMAEDILIERSTIDWIEKECNARLDHIYHEDVEKTGCWDYTDAILVFELNNTIKHIVLLECGHNKKVDTEYEYEMEEEIWCNRCSDLTRFTGKIRIKKANKKLNKKLAEELR